MASSVALAVKIFGKLRTLSKTKTANSICKRLSSHESCDVPAVQEKPDELFYSPPKSIKVAVINSSSDVGKITNLILKQDPLIKELRMFCWGHTLGLATDLKPIPSSTKSFSFTGNSLHIALKNADIVFCVSDQEPDDMNLTTEVFEANTKYVKHVATAVAKHCPEAVVGIDIYPINSTVPMFAKIMSNHGVYCPNKILGVMSLHTLRARSVIACILGVNPASVQVDILGGGTPDTMIPLISSAAPGGQTLASRADEISLGIANMSSAVWAVNKYQAKMSAAHANASFVHDVAKGLTGAESRGHAFLRNGSLYGLKYSSMPVEYGLAGVSRVLKTPRMSKNEISRFDQAIPLMQDHIDLGERAAETRVLAEARSSEHCN